MVWKNRSQRGAATTAALLSQIPVGHVARVVAVGAVGPEVVAAEKEMAPSYVGASYLVEVDRIRWHHARLHLHKSHSPNGNVVLPDAVCEPDGWAVELQEGG